MAVTIDIGNALRKVGLRSKEINDSEADGRGYLLKESHILTFRAILKIAKRQKLAQLPGHDSPTVAIRTTNRKIATMRGMSARTVQRHRERLQELGIIAGHIFRGSHHHFDVLVHESWLGLADILEAAHLVEQVKARREQLDILEQRLEATPPPLQESPNVDIMSALYPSGIEHINEGNDYVHRLGVLRTSSGLPCGEANGAPSREEEMEAQEANTPQDRRQAGGRRKAPKGTKAPAPTLPRAETDMAMARLLWQFARKVLWPGLEVNARREKQILDACYSLYSRLPDGQDNVWHGRFVEMVGLTSEFIQRRPGRFVVPPWRWFDTKVDHGIRGTWPWWLARMRAKEDAKAENAMFRAVARYTQNEAKPPSKQRNRVELYLDLKRGLAAFGKPWIIDAFDSQIVNLEGKQHGKAKQA